MNLHMLGKGSGGDSKPATFSGDTTDRANESSGLMGMPAAGGSMDYSAQSIDNGSALAPHKSASLVRAVAVLAVLLAIAGTGLITMRSMGKKGLIDELEVKIDVNAIAEAGDGVVTTDHVALIQDLRGAGEFVQVPLDNVQMNPFTLRIAAEAKPVAANTPRPETEDERQARERAERLAVAQREFQKLRLNSVMGGSVPIAQISGNLVRVGDIVSERFRVQKISGRSVELAAEGEVFVLVIDE
jgi:hypothetical protein